MPGEPDVQRQALPVLPHQVMPLSGQVGVGLRDAGDSGEPLEKVVFAIESRDRVDAVAVQSGVGPGLLDEHLLATAFGQVDGGAVGLAEHLGDPVRRHRRVGVLRDAVGDPDPVRHGELRALRRGFERAARPAQRGHAGAAVFGPQGRESAVMHVNRAFSTAKRAVDIRSGLAGEEFGKIVEDPFERVIVGRINSGQCTGSAGGRIFGIAVEENRPGTQMPVVQPGGPAVLADAVQYPVGIAGSGGNLHGPALFRQNGSAGVEVTPVSAVLGSPLWTVRRGGQVVGGYFPSAVEEPRIGEAECLVPDVHENGSFRVCASPVLRRRKPFPHSFAVAPIRHFSVRRTRAGRG